MIKANELRLGNYFIEDGEIKTVNSHTFNSVVFDDLQPIPLTPEILENCGFEFKTGWKANGGEIEVEQYELNTSCGLFDASCSSTGAMIISWRDKDFPKCDYLHQLQNLFFAITGKELETKKPR